MALTDTDFENKYSLDETITTSVGFTDENGKLETYGKDLETVMEIAAKTPKRIWSFTDGDDGDLLIVAGMSKFSRPTYYIITNEEWEDETEEYIVEF